MTWLREAPSCSSAPPTLSLLESNSSWDELEVCILIERVVFTNASFGALSVLITAMYALKVSPTKRSPNESGSMRKLDRGKLNWASEVMKGEVEATYKDGLYRRITRRVGCCAMSLQYTLPNNHYIEKYKVEEEDEEEVAVRQSEVVFE